RVAVAVGVPARPEDAHPGLDLLVGDARVVGHPAPARPPQLVEDLPRAAEGEAVLAAERLRDVLEDAPVLPRVPGRLDSLVDLDHPALGRADGPLVLLVLG